MKTAQYLGIDITTGELALAVRDQEGQEGYAVMSMDSVRTQWKDDPSYPAFHIVTLPHMVMELLERLEKEGWNFDFTGDNAVSVSCRQHDMVLLGENDELLTPAISWQCNAADKEAARLNRRLEVLNSVGTIEPRLILPKLLHVLSVEPTLRGRLRRVMTTGDWLAYKLTGLACLHVSELQSNGLWDQAHNSFAAETFIHLNLPLELGWFPDPISSGELIGVVRLQRFDEDWRRLSQKLSGWLFKAGLGDNHAAAVGCGVRDSSCILVSAGTSGTVNWVSPERPLDATGIMAFNFYTRRLWLLMHGSCGESYKAFVSEHLPHLKRDYSRLNDTALVANLLRPTLYAPDGAMYFPPGFTTIGAHNQIASVQYTIALALLRLLRRMHAAIPATVGLTKVILTGGLSQSIFFREAIQVGLSMVAPDLTLHLSGQQGPLRYKTTAAGALVNAEFGSDLGKIPGERFPLLSCPSVDPLRQVLLRVQLKKDLSL